MDENLDDILHILHIDDDESMRRLVTEILAPYGHQVISCESAEEGLAQLPYFTFHVAFLDHNLPGMEGLVFGEYLRGNNPHMAIALVTGSSDVRLERTSRDLEIHFIPKPFDVGRLLDVVDAYREGARDRHAAEVSEGSPDFVPSFHGNLGEWFRVPRVPDRIEGILFRRISESLASLRSVHRYTEKDRTMALSGILAAKVLGLQLPKARSGRRLDAEFDALMQEHGRRAEFAPGTPDE
jgi:CheY-like chemotaxis protein